MSELTRRSLFSKVALGSVMVAVPSLSMLSEVEAAAFNKAVDLNNMTDLEKIHIPKVTLPPVVEDGNQAPIIVEIDHPMDCLLYTSPSPRDAHESRMPSSA